MTPLVSILIPCYNHGRFLAQAVDSALGQTHQPLEVLVLDDGSTDQTPAVAARYGDRIRYLRLDHGGLSATRNAGLDALRGAYWANLDADNAFEPTFVADMLGFLLAGRPRPMDFVYCQRTLFGDPAREGHVSRFPTYEPARFKTRNHIDASCVLVSSEASRGVRYDPQFRAGWEDYDFFLSLLERGACCELLDRPLVRYRVHGQTLTGGIVRSRLQRSLMKMILRKHASFYSADERRAARRSVSNQILVGVISSRTPGRPLADRCRDLHAFVAEGGPRPELLPQCLYTLSPAAYVRWSRRNRERLGG